MSQSLSFKSCMKSRSLENLSFYTRIFPLMLNIFYLPSSQRIQLTLRFSFSNLRQTTSSNSKVTIAVWIYARNTDKEQVIFATGRLGTPGYMLVIYSTKRLLGQVIAETAASQSVSDTDFTTYFDKWTHVAMTYAMNSEYATFLLFAYKLLVRRLKPNRNQPPPRVFCVLQLNA